jgi:ribulose-phosphate 3-epimerase
MTEIIPAVLPKDYEELKDKIALVRGIAPVVQVDICDGIFVKNTTWPFLGSGELDQHFSNIQNEEEGMPFWEDIDFEIDLMVSDALENFDIYCKLGARRIIFHAEATKNLQELQEFLEGMDNFVRDTIEIGIACGPSFKVENLLPLLATVDFVQVMGIDRIGVQGEKFDYAALELIKAIKEKVSDIPVGVDGGVNLETAPEIIAAGADRLAIGSAIFNSNDIMERIEEFRSL